MYNTYIIGLTLTTVKQVLGRGGGDGWIVGICESQVKKKNGAKCVLHVPEAPKVKNVGNIIIQQTAAVQTAV